MHKVLKMHFYLFSGDFEMDCNLQFTRNCGYISDARLFSTSKGAVVRPEVVVRAHSACRRDTLNIAF